jgi:hypothetical protein
VRQPWTLHYVISANIKSTTVLNSPYLTCHIGSSQQHDPSPPSKVHVCGGKGHLKIKGSHIETGVQDFPYMVCICTNSIPKTTFYIKGGWKCASPSNPQYLFYKLSQYHLVLHETVKYFCNVNRFFSSTLIHTMHSSLQNQDLNKFSTQYLKKHIRSMIISSHIKL